MRWRRKEPIPIPPGEPKRWWVTEINSKGRYQNYLLWEDGTTEPLNEFNINEFGWKNVLEFVRERPGFEPVRERKKVTADEAQHALHGV